MDRRCFLGLLGCCAAQAVVPGSLGEMTSAASFPTLPDFPSIPKPTVAYAFEVSGAEQVAVSFARIEQVCGNVAERRSCGSENEPEVA